MGAAHDPADVVVAWWRHPSPGRLRLTTLSLLRWREALSLVGLAPDAFLSRLATSRAALGLLFSFFFHMPQGWLSSHCPCEREGKGGSDADADAVGFLVALVTTSALVLQQLNAAWVSRTTMQRQRQRQRQQGRADSDGDVDEEEEYNLLLLLHRMLAKEGTTLLAGLLSFLSTLPQCPREGPPPPPHEQGEEPPVFASGSAMLSWGFLCQCSWVAARHALRCLTPFLYRCFDDAGPSRGNRRHDDKGDDDDGVTSANCTDQPNAARGLVCRTSPLVLPFVREQLEYYRDGAKPLPALRPRLGCPLHLAFLLLDTMLRDEEGLAAMASSLESAILCSASLPDSGIELAAAVQALLLRQGDTTNGLTGREVDIAQQFLARKAICSSFLSQLW